MHRVVSLTARALVRHGLIEPPDPAAPGQFAWARQEVIAEHLEAAGFVEFELGSVEFTNHHASMEDWWRTQEQISSRMREALPGADPAVIEAIKAELATEVEPFTAADGSITVPARTWTAVATA